MRPPGGEHRLYRRAFRPRAEGGGTPMTSEPNVSRTTSSAAQEPAGSLGGSPAFWLMLAAAVGTIMVFAVITGSARRAAVERERAVEIDREDRLSCQKLGMGHGSDGFAACASLLAETRARHEQRLAADLGDFF